MVTPTSSRTEVFFGHAETVRLPNGGGVLTITPYPIDECSSHWGRSEMADYGYLPMPENKRHHHRHEAR